jgi:outer membrane protein OmpA-like peptidoglycan-associated protein
VVLGTHANAPTPEIDLLDCYLSPALTDGHRIVVIVSDGQPHPVMDMTVSISAKPQTGLQDRNEIRARLQQALDAAADQEENNPLEAISQAARSISTASGPRLVLVADSMLQTAGALPMQDGLLGIAAEDAVEYLTESGQLPDLTGTTVVLLGLGVTAPPQEPLDSRATAQLEQLWTGILTAAGAEVLLDVRIPTIAPDRALPTVTPVPIESPTPPEPVQECRVRLEDATIGFKPDSADFIEPEAARSLLDQVADELRGCPAHLVITGTTSSAGTAQGRQAVATARATAVAQELSRRLSVPLDNIEIRGVGMNFNEYVPDRDANGLLIPDKAQQNRSVIIEAQ